MKQCKPSIAWYLRCHCPSPQNADIPFYKPWRPKLFSIWNHHISQLFSLHSTTYMLRDYGHYHRVKCPLFYAVLMIKVFEMNYRTNLINMYTAIEFEDSLLNNSLPSKHKMPTQCWTILSAVYDADPSLDKHWVDVSYSLSTTLNHEHQPQSRCLYLGPENDQCKTHHYIIFFVRSRHSKPEMESYCLSSKEQLSR